MKISIITISYNNQEHIEQTIQSVLNQDYSNIEYIVIDGNSTDETLERIEKYEEHIDVLISEKDDGIYDAMNKGLRHATGTVIGFINADDILESAGSINSIVQTFQNTEADVVYGDILYVDSNNLERTIRHWKPGNFDKNKFKKGWMPPHPATYIRKRCFEQYGNFDNMLKSAGDYELFLRIMYINDTKAVYIPNTIARMRAGGVSNRSLFSYIQNTIEVYKSWRKHGLWASPLLLMCKPLSKIPQFLDK